MRFLLSMIAIPLLVLGAAQPSGAQGDPCGGYKWDVSKERALFATSAKTFAAGKDGTSAVPIAPNQLYAVTLLPVAQVSFPATPAKAPTSGSFAGIVALTVPVAGKYRIAVDVPLWIDVAAGSILAPVVDYAGVHECNAPRKVVEFDLEGRTDWMLELSAADRAAVRFVVIAVR